MNFAGKGIDFDRLNSEIAHSRLNERPRSSPSYCVARCNAVNLLFKSNQALAKSRYASFHTRQTSEACSKESAAEMIMH